MKRIIGYILITIVSILSFFQLLQTMKIVFGSFNAYLWFIAGIVCFSSSVPSSGKMKHGSPLSPMNWPTPLQAYWCSTRCTPWKCTNKRKHAISGKKQHLHYIGTLLLPHLHLFHLIADASQFRTLFMHFPISYRADIGIPHTLLHPANPPNQTDIKQNGKMISYSFIFMWWLFNASIILYAVKYGIYRAVIYQFQGMWTNLLAPF